MSSKTMLVTALLSYVATAAPGAAAFVKRIRRLEKMLEEYVDLSEKAFQTLNGSITSVASTLSATKKEIASKPSPKQQVKNAPAKKAPAKKPAQKKNTRPNASARRVVE